MKKITIAAISGIRSHLVKIASIQSFLSENEKQLPCKFEIIYIDAGQHYDYILSDAYKEELNLHIDYFLNYTDKDPWNIFSEMIKNLYFLIKQLNEKKKLDYVLVFGDTNTTMAGAIVAVKMQIPLVHIESGIRLNTWKSPEESNRVVADRLSTIRFVSCRSDMYNLRNEGLEKNSFFVGDILYEFVEKVNKSSNISQVKYMVDGIDKVYEYVDDFVLASLHRNENLIDGVLKTYMQALEYVPHNVLFLAHPRVLKMLEHINFNKKKITIAEYIPYNYMLFSIKKSRYILTDSGSFQREAFYLKKRCLVRQDKAYWQTLVDKGAHCLIATDLENMMQGIQWAENNHNEYPIIDDLGNGTAVEQILKILSREDIIFNDIS